MYQWSSVQKEETSSDLEVKRGFLTVQEKSFYTQKKPVPRPLLTTG